MGAGFTRRFTTFPPLDVLTAIEGINIIDLAPPSASTGVSENVIGLVGEFADNTYAVAVDSSGNITTSPQPVEIFSGQDLLNKLGGFDATLGAFGSSCGNGYVELRNKKFGRLVVCPVNMASSAGIRMWRQLPTNQSASNPTPVVPVAAAVVPAGYILKDNAQVLERMLVGGAVQFSNAIAYLTGVDGTVTNGAAAATNTLTSAGGGFTTIARPDGLTGVQVGDILVTGVVGLAGVQGDDAGTWRVVSITSDTVIVVQALNGANFDWTTSSVVLAWRLHPASAADSYGQGLLTNQGTYTVPVRPLTNDAGTGSGSTNGTWATGTLLSPLVAPPALTISSADPLSGLAGSVGPTTAVAYTAAVQKANAASSSAIDVLYTAAIASFLNDDVPESEVAHLWCARKSATIRNQLKTHALNQSAQGVGRTVSISPELNQASTSVVATVTGSSDPGVGANRDERTFYDWPPVLTFVPEAVGVVINCADGSQTTDGMLDTTGDGWLSSIMGNLAPERNPGEASTTTETVLAPVLGYARGVPMLNLPIWQLLKLRGICGIRMDKTVGPVFQSGVTTSLIAGLTSISRRKMADYVEDSLAVVTAPFSKLPLSNTTTDAALGEIVDFLELLLSADNPAAQRINAYLVDDVSGNTPESTALGIFVFIVKVRTLASADFIVLQCTVGPGVDTSGTNS